MRKHLLAIVEAETALREMGVLSSGTLVGDVAEWIACQELGHMLEPKSTKGYDATDADGLRLQIKGVRLPNCQPGAMRGLRDNPFDRFVVVALASDMQSYEIIEMTSAEARERAAYQEFTNSWRLTV
jgi:hypothetical protein